MGVGSNPAFWFVAVTIILIGIRFILDLMEVPMKTKSQSKTKLRATTAACLETFWVIAANMTVGLVTLSIHQKAAPKIG